jgi:hypothetical protein
MGRRTNEQVTAKRNCKGKSLNAEDAEEGAKGAEEYAER